MVTLRGMAEHRFSNVYFYQCLALVLYFYTWILIFPLILFPSYLLSSSFYWVELSRFIGSFHFYTSKFWRKDLIWAGLQSFLLCMQSMGKTLVRGLYPITKFTQDQIGKRNPTDKALSSCLDISPQSEPALKWIAGLCQVWRHITVY